MVNFFLFPLSWVYLFFLSLDRKLTKKKKLLVKVISVGNITVGGSGKTPTVISLARKLKDKGIKVTVLSRGYARKNQKSKIKNQNSCVVSDGEKILLTPEETGDEPYLLAEKLEGVPVIVGKDRYKAGLLAKEKFSPQVIILDDGFQHWKLDRNSDIVCLDCLTFLEKEPLFPLGTLREKISALWRANLIVLTQVDLITQEELTLWYKFLGAVCPQVPVVESIYQPVALQPISQGHSEPKVKNLKVEFLEGKEIILLSAIANPLFFEEKLKKLGAKMIKHYSFPDHYWYKPEDLQTILSESVSRDCPIVTTEKDAVKIKRITNYELRITNKIYVLEIELRITKGKEIWENILSISSSG